MIYMFIHIYVYNLLYFSKSHSLSLVGNQVKFSADSTTLLVKLHTNESFLFPLETKNE